MSSGPVFWIIAGPNGSGKTTASRSPRIRAALRSPRILNPDAVAYETLVDRGYDGFDQVPEKELRDIFLASAVAVESEVESSIAARMAVSVETVLSSDKYKQHVESVKSAGGFFGLVFLCPRSPDINVARVAIRTSQGGHDVPEEKVRARYQRSIENAEWFLRKADVGLVFDTSDADPSVAPLLVATARRGIVKTVDHDADIAPQLRTVLTLLEAGE